MTSPAPRVPCRILIVEDEAILALGLRETLEDLGHVVVGTVASGEEALRLASEVAPELVFMDIRLAGDLDGIATAERLRATRPIPVVYLTAYADEETIRRARITEPFGYLHKPCQPRDLRAAIELARYKAQAEQKLRASERRYAATVHGLADGVLVVDARGQVTLLNPVAERLTGWSAAAALGQPLADVLPLPGCAAHPLAAALRQRALVATVPGTLARRRDGTDWPIEGLATPLDSPDPDAGAVFAFRDIGDRQRVEEALRYTQKLESLGVLAAGVAHDFNNLLTPVLGYVSLVAEQLPAESPLVLMLRQAEQAARHAADLTQQLLSYAGQRAVERQPVNLSTLLGGMASLLTAGRPTRIHLDERLAPELPAVEGDPVQLRQIILNLIVNAYEAIDETTGTIQVRTAVRTVDAAYLRDGFVPDPLAPGEYVALDVTDSGRGIAPENLPRLFDPFFSTKLLGRGLGLAATLGIVRAHRGGLRVRTQPGQGTTFSVLLPPSTRRLAAPAPVEEPAAQAALQGTVLVVAQDTSLRLLFRRLLELAGLTVLVADTPEEMPPAALDLILFDTGGTGGAARTTLAALQTAYPEVPVVLSAGLDPTEVVACCAEQTPAAILHKPFRPIQLTSLVARLLQRNAARPR